MKDDQTGTEQDWLAGEKDGREGVFPAAYAAAVDESKPTNGVTQQQANSFDSGGQQQDNFFGSGFNQAR